MGWWNWLATARVSLVRVFLALALLCAGIAVGYGFSVARAQDESATIYACVNKWNGTTRIVDEGVNCSRSENLVSWDQHGSSGVISGYEVVTDSIELDYIATSSRPLSCPTGKVALAGAALIEGTELEIRGDAPILSQLDSSLATGWYFTFVNATEGGGGSGTVHLSVTCANAPQG